MDINMKAWKGIVTLLFAIMLIAGFLVEWPPADESVIPATINTTYAELGTYTLGADDGDGTTDDVTVEIGAPTPTPTPTPPLRRGGGGGGASANDVDEGSEPGTDVEITEVTMGSIVPQVTETGKISLSVDGLGVVPETTGIIQVEKPAGATVRAAYMAAATTGGSNYHLLPRDILIDGDAVTWFIETRSSINSWNYWADVTPFVKPKIDGASTGRVDFTITEINSDATDGELLAVIFDDPSQTTDNTIVLLFGAQKVDGDTFAIGLAEPIDTTDPNLVLDMSLGISFGSQLSNYYNQYSEVDVNGVRLTSSAGGQDDAVVIQSGNGALLTAGGLDDSNANPPDPNLHGDSTSPFYDDELYDLIPFVSDGDTAITVYTLNPSRDDNIFFASLFLASTTAVVGEGILLAPVSATNPVGSSHTVTATVQDDLGNPIVGREVTFTIVSGPHTGFSGIDTTDANGEATYTYTGTTAGTDVIEASMVDSQGVTVTSNQVTKVWTGEEIPEFSTIALPVASILGLLFFFNYRKRREEN